MKQLNHMQAWYGKDEHGREFLYSYESHVADVVTGKGGTCKVIFGRDAFYSASTGKQVSRYFEQVQGRKFPELCYTAGRREAIKRGYTLDENGATVDVCRDFNMI